MIGPQTRPEEDHEKKLAELNNVPLFMTSVDMNGDEPNDALEALRALAYEGTPDGSPNPFLNSPIDTFPEVATNFKQQGNDYYKGKRFKEASNFYTQAIDAKPDSKPLLESLFANRAACNLELSEIFIDCSVLSAEYWSENYGRVLQDCAAILGDLNPKSLKALFRSASALLSLEKATETIDCCDRGLALDPSNEQLKSIREKAMVLKDKADAKDREKREREFKGKKLRMALKVNASM